MSLTEKKKRDVKAILEQMITVDVPDIMQLIIADTKVDAVVKAARVGLASTALHHLRLLRAAYE